MTVNEIDRVMRLLTDMRVDQADRFARIEERLAASSGLPARVDRLEEQCSQIGRFNMGDVYRFVGAVAASSAVATFIIQSQ